MNDRTTSHKPESIAPLLRLNNKQRTITDRVSRDFALGWRGRGIRDGGGDVGDVQSVEL